MRARVMLGPWPYTGGAESLQTAKHRKEPRYWIVEESANGYWPLKGPMLKTEAEKLLPLFLPRRWDRWVERLGVTVERDVGFTNDPFANWRIRGVPLVLRTWRRESWRPFFSFKYVVVAGGAFGFCFQVMKVYPPRGR